MLLLLSCTGLLPSLAGLSIPLLLKSRVNIADPQPQGASPLVWPLSLSLAATQEIDVSFSSSGYLDVSVPRVPSTQTMYSSESDGVLPPPGFPIQISTDRCLLAAPHGFSQLATSFFGVWCLGIHPCALLSLIFSSLILRPIVFTSNSREANPLQLAFSFKSFLCCAVVKVQALFLVRQALKTIQSETHFFNNLFQNVRQRFRTVSRM